MRLFVGIDLPEDAKEALYQLSMQLKRSSRTGSFVPLENTHLTLAFIGETKQIDTVKEALRQAATSYRASPAATTDSRFELELSGIGSFKRKKGHTWWVGVKELPERQRLQALHDEVVNALRNEGFDLENRSYKPHITLARSVRTTEYVCLEPPPIVLPVEEFCLFNSRHVDGSQEYTIMERYRI